MSSQPVTLNLPQPLFNRVRKMAEQSQRSIETELLEMVAQALPEAEELPDELADAVAALSLLNDDDLWRAARSHIAVEAVAQMEALHIKRQTEGLSESESETLQRLLYQYERAMLIRARAAALLKQRGYDVSSLVSPQ